MLLLPSNNITMESQERLLWLSRLLPGGPCAYPTAQMLSATQSELMAMMHSETEKILELRRKLEEEMRRISEDFISSNHLETESYLDVIKQLKNDYQDAIEDMVDMYREVLEKPEVLDEWTHEAKEIAKLVKKHANVTRTRVLKLDANF